MKADVVFMGGGLASLVAGIRLLKSGKSVIIISAGQSALHFSSGSMCLLNRFNDEIIDSPLDYIDKLQEDHPYRKVGGSVQVLSLLDSARNILEEAGLEFEGTIQKNHQRITPFGVLSPAWLTLSDHLVIQDPDNLPFKKAAVIGIEGFLDFYPNFLAKGLENLRVESIISKVNIEEFDVLRNNPTEMRAPNIARALNDESIENYARAINRKLYDCDIALIPSVVGLNDSEQFKRLRDLVECPVFSITTIPVAVTGIRMKILLQQLFTNLGGWYLLGDSVTDGKIEDSYLYSINTSNLGSSAIKADNFVLSTGGLFSRGLKSDLNHIYEPIFGLDVTYHSDRSEWYDNNFYHSQPFMKFGVCTDNDFRCILNGKPVKNLYAMGSILGGDFDPLYDGVGAGVTLSSALYVANKLI